MSKHVMVLGGTGLVGSQLLELLMVNPLIERIYCVVRRPVNIQHSKIHCITCDDFNQLSSTLDQYHLPHIDAAFSCFGSTIKQAGSKQVFRQIDFGYTYQFAAWCKQKHIGQFLCVSALGAASDSYFFYNRIKGELEHALIGLNFNQLGLFRPSLLLGHRQERRFAEAASIQLLNLIRPFMSQQWSFYPIEAKQVATAMIYTMFTQTESIRIYDNYFMLGTSLEETAK